MQHSDHLFGNGARPSDSAPGAQVLHQRVHPRWPIYPAVLVKALVLSSAEGLLQEEWHGVEGHNVVHIPRVLKGHGQRYTCTIQHLGSTEVGIIRGQRGRERE
jgi:hypothetical protein